MRLLIWLILLVPLCWSGWWFFAAHSMQSGLTQWLDDRRAEGWQADVQQMKLSGFPLALEQTLIEPALADPDTGVAFTTETIIISAPAWWPGDVTLRFPEEEVVLASTLERHVIQAQAARADLRLHPGPTLELEELALTSGPWSVDTPNGSTMTAQGLTVRLLQSDDISTAYDIKLEAPAFQPGSVPRRAWRIPQDWPIAFESLTLDATVGFDRPLDRATIEEARPQPRRLDLHLAEAAWGALLVRIAAALDVDETGLLSGELSLQAQNWRDMLSLAETAGALPPSFRPQLENILAALARGSVNPDTIDITITLRQGTMYLGFIPLGNAPRLILR